LNGWAPARLDTELPLSSARTKHACTSSQKMSCHFVYDTGQRLATPPRARRTRAHESLSGFPEVFSLLRGSPGARPCAALSQSQSVRFPPAARRVPGPSARPARTCPVAGGQGPDLHRPPGRGVTPVCSPPPDRAARAPAPTPSGCAWRTQIKAPPAAQAAAALARPALGCAWRTPPPSGQPGRRTPMAACLQRVLQTRRDDRSAASPPRTRTGMTLAASSEHREPATDGSSRRPTGTAPVPSGATRPATGPAMHDGAARAAPTPRWIRRRSRAAGCEPIRPATSGPGQAGQCGNPRQASCNTAGCRAEAGGPRGTRLGPVLVAAPCAPRRWTRRWPGTWRHCLAVDLGSRVTVRRRHPGGHPGGQASNLPTAPGRPPRRFVGDCGEASLPWPGPSCRTPCAGFPYYDFGSASLTSSNRLQRPGSHAAASLPPTRPADLVSEAGSSSRGTRRTCGDAQRSSK